MSMHSGSRISLAGLAAALVCGGLTAGCGHLMQARDHVEPLAVPVMMQEQVMNPEAGKNRKVVAGLDGNAAANVSESYSKTFIKTEKQSTTSFQGLEGLSTD
jgi:hypothetical protein